jgi:predicted RNA-binding protein (virulence factor B family)
LRNIDIWEEQLLLSCIHANNNTTVRIDVHYYATSLFGMFAISRANAHVRCCCLSELGATCQGGQELNEFTIYNKYDSMIVGSTTIYPLDNIEHISRTIQQKVEPWHRALE